MFVGRVKMFGCYHKACIELIYQTKYEEVSPQSAITQELEELNYLCTSDRGVTVSSLITFHFLVIQFYEGYGQTESTAGCCLTLPGDWTAGTFGGTVITGILLFGLELN